MLFERDSEVGSLESALEETSEGGKVVLVRGEAGVGKSALIRQFLASNAGIHAHVGYCDDLLTAQPLGPFWDVARDEPKLGPYLEASDRRGIMETVQDLMSQTLRPTVLVIEDTQWIDEASLDVIRHLGRRIDTVNGLLILTYRDEEVDFSHPLRGVIGSVAPDSVVRMTLEPLSIEAVGDMVGNIDVDLDRLIDLTGGNPLLVKELAAAGTDGVPESIQAAVLGRAARLRPEVRAYVDLVSVVPGGLSRQLLDELGRNDPSIEDDAVKSGLVVVGDGRVGVHHEIARRVLEGALSPAARREMNGMIMSALIGIDADPARIAHHAQRSEDVSAIVEFTPLAAARAMQAGSHREALEHFRSLEPHLGEIDESRRGAIVENWARSEFFHDNAEALGILESAIAIYRDRGDEAALVNALTFAVRLFEVNGEPLKAEAAAAEAQRLADSIGDPALAAAAKTQAAWLYLMRGEPDRAQKIADEAQAGLEHAGDNMARIRNLNTRGYLAYLNSDPQGIELLEDARALAASSGEFFEEARAIGNLAGALHETMDIEHSGAYAREAVRIAGQYEIEPLESYGKWLVAELHVMAGSWDDAENLLYETLESHPHVLVQSLATLGLLHARRGLDDADDLLRRSYELAARSLEVQNLGPWAASWAEFCWIRDRHDDDLLHECASVLPRVVAAKLPFAAGKLALWLNLLGRLEQVPRRLPDPYTLMVQGELETAAETWAERGFPYEAALAQLVRGGGEAVGALETLEELGAGAVAAKFRRRLRSDGVAVPRGRGRRTRAHPAGLTARQAEVLTLVADGLANSDIANRLFLSLRTVENHVSAILSKLGASNREQAAELASNAGLL